MTGYQHDDQCEGPDCPKCFSTVELAGMPSKDLAHLAWHVAAEVRARQEAAEMLGDVLGKPGKPGSVPWHDHPPGLHPREAAS